MGLKKDGFLYVDTVSKAEIDKGNHDIEVDYSNIKLKGRIEYDFDKKVRRTYGQSLVNGNFFKGGITSYLLTPDELEGMIRSFDPQKVWHPELKHEPNYHVVCAIK